jgi:aspartyl aminopeptidase
MKDAQAAAGLVDFVRACPSMFHTASTIRAALDAAGFTYLPESSAWSMETGGRYYTVRNNSSVVALKVGSELDAYHFQLAAAHGDSPTFKVKAVPELTGPQEYLRLDVEAYGGMIDHTWLDRPLGIAGRVLVRDGAHVRSRLVNIEKDVALIPNVAIHLGREAGLEPHLSRAVDLFPLFSAGALPAGSFDEMVAASVGVDPADVLARDLFLVNHEQPRVWGWADEFVSAGHLDDLECAYVALQAFLATDNPHDVSVYACFDNEEVGSNTKQGALSTLLRDVLERTNAALGGTDEGYHRALAASMLVSCDNAHALHPNHPEKHDEVNRCRLNGGVVIKEAANQHYCTDAFSRAAFVAILDAARVPYQTFANRSDMAGGGTLGNLSNVQASMHAVDVGMPQLAMHSAYETAGARDVALGIRAISAFFSADVLIEGADSVTLA